MLICLVTCLVPFALPALAQDNKNDKSNQTRSSQTYSKIERWCIEGWDKTDFSRLAISPNEILSGGPPKDGIPSIDTPRFIPQTQEKTLGAQEPVITIKLKGIARAYPLRILIWHEIVNDKIADLPIAVTYCPLCNAAIVFRRVVDGVELNFGTTGKLRNSDLVMYDRQSESWWQQFSGEAIIGKYMGKSLKIIPARLESFERFQSRHPNGEVLIPPNPPKRPYGATPYYRYDSSAVPFLHRGDLPKGIPAMARVVIVKLKNKPYAITLEALRKRERIEIADVVLSWHKGQNSVLDARQIAQGKDVGNVVAQKKSGRALKDIAYDVTFAFVFHAFYPGLPIHKE